MSKQRRITLKGRSKQTEKKQRVARMTVMLYMYMLQ